LAGENEIDVAIPELSYFRRFLWSMAVALTCVVIAGANIIPLRLCAFALNQRKRKGAKIENLHHSASVTTRGILIGRPIAILYFLARKITAEGAEERKSS